MSAACLTFIILAATRSREAREALWSEIRDGIWTIPADRMKRVVEHRVPLCPEAIEVLDRMRGLDADLVFPNPSEHAGSQNHCQYLVCLAHDADEIQGPDDAWLSVDLPRLVRRKRPS